MADEPAGDIRSTILAELSAQPDAPAEVPTEEAADAPAEDAGDAAEPVLDGDDGNDAPAEDVGDSDDPVEDEAVSDDEDEAESDDPVTQKRLDAVRKAEKRARANLERDKAAFDQERQQHKADLEQVAQFKQLAQRLRYDPAAVFRALGASDEDFLVIAQAAYAESPEGSKDPNRKAAAAQALKEREKADKLTANEKRIMDLEARLERQQAEAVAQAEAARYIEQINTAAATKFPLTAHMLKVDTAETNEALVATYDRLMKTTGRAPKPAEVVAAYDKRERARLQKLGIDPATIAKTPAAKPKAAANANAAKAAPGKPAVNGAAKSATPTREEILAELATLHS